MEMFYKDMSTTIRLMISRPDIRLYTSGMSFNLIVSLGTLMSPFSKYFKAASVSCRDPTPLIESARTTNGEISVSIFASFEIPVHTIDEFFRINCIDCPKDLSKFEIFIAPCAPPLVYWNETGYLDYLVVVSIPF